MITLYKRAVYVGGDNFGTDVSVPFLIKHGENTVLLNDVMTPDFIEENNLDTVGAEESFWKVGDILIFQNTSDDIHDFTVVGNHYNSIPETTVVSPLFQSERADPTFTFIAKIVKVERNFGALVSTPHVSRITLDRFYRDPDIDNAAVFNPEEMDFAYMTGTDVPSTTANPDRNFKYSAGRISVIRGAGKLAFEGGNEVFDLEYLLEERETAREKGIVSPGTHRVLRYTNGEGVERVRSECLGFYRLGEGDFTVEDFFELDFTAVVDAEFME